jgi:Fe-S cluster assembly protein SufD
MEKIELAENIVREYEEVVKGKGSDRGSGSGVGGSDIGGSDIGGGMLEGVREIKEEAMEYFRKKGFPTRRDEEWRYTNINPLLKRNYTIKADDTIKADEAITEKDIKKYLIKGLDANLVVIVNGRYSEELSKIEDSKDFYAVSLKKAFAEKRELVLEYYSKSYSKIEDTFTALNTALSTDGLFLHIQKNAIIEKPFLILNITGSKSGEVLASTRNIIIAEQSAQATVIDLYHNYGNNYSFSNALTEVFTKENSTVKYYKIQNDDEKSHSINTVQARISRAAEFDTFVISWGGEIIRNNLNSVLEGEGAECIMKGIYLSTGSSLIDNHTLVDHAVPNCHSNQTYRGILGGTSYGVFNGKIMVRKDAQKTNAYQSNKNILISDTAVVNAKPQLEIFADDVKCSHGATTGQLNPEELFYLRSRGIAKEEAMKLLLNAFLDELILEIDIEPLKSYLEKILNEKLS